MTIITTSPSKFMVSTVSTLQQQETEDECSPFFADLSCMPASQMAHLRECGLVSEDSLDICLLVEKHVKYLSQTWNPEQNLKMSFVSLDSSRPWMLYWCIHACDLMNHTLEDEDCIRIFNTIKACWMDIDERSGGFGGGIMQMPHAATSYAAINTYVDKESDL